MKELRTEIERQASPERVWQALTNLDKYPEQNKFEVGGAIVHRPVVEKARSGRVPRSVQGQSGNTKVRNAAVTGIWTFKQKKRGLQSVFRPVTLDICTMTIEAHTSQKTCEPANTQVHW